MTESRISSALHGRLRQFQDSAVGRLVRSVHNTASSAAKKPFPAFEVWPNDVLLAVLPHAVERNSGFAVASRRARGLSLENAIDVVGDAVRRSGRANDLAAREAYRFLRKVIFSTVAAGPAANPAEQATRHAGSESARLSAAVGLMAASARRAFNGGAVAWDAHAARDADRAIKTFLSYVRIEAGEFTMGSSQETDPNRYPDEVQHRVRLTQPFMLKATAVTQGEWFELMGNNPSYFQAERRPNGERAATCPVEWVNWYDVLAYCNALSRRDGYRPCFDLSACTGMPGVDFGPPPGAEDIPFDETADGYQPPSEARWEYAARAGTQTATYARPGQSLDAIAWTSSNAGDRTHPVELKLPNAWGLDGMIGNTWEWTRDKHGPLAPAGHDNPAVDPRGADAGVNRVFRGGYWLNAEPYARAAYRNYGHPAKRSGLLGFRPARSLFP
jgi:sulfatase modifying factor 1